MIKKWLFNSLVHIWMITPGKLSISYKMKSTQSKVILVQGYKAGYAKTILQLQFVTHKRERI